MSSTQIGKALKVSHRTVLNHLEKMGIKRRNLSESQFAYNKKEIPKDFSDYKKMYELYIEKHMTKEQLGNYFGCAPHVIDRVLREFNIPIRDSSTAKIGVQRGDKHHNWKGGITPLDLRVREFFQKNISPKIRKRDNYTCQMCGNHSNLHVHHKVKLSQIIKEIINEYSYLDIEKDREKLYEIIINDKRFLDEDNLITYCKKCHLLIVHGNDKTIRSEAS